MKKNKGRMLSLVTPFYNDAGCPRQFVKDLRGELAKEGIKNYELILVDDCSKDETPKELKMLANRKVRVFCNKVNKDYGGAIMTGLDVAVGDILGFTCGDGEVSAKDIVKVYKQMNEEDDIIKATRLNRQDGWQRKYISKVFNIWSKLRFGLKIPDINGYPVYFKAEAYKEAKKIGAIKTDWLFNIDLFRKMLSKGYKLRNIPVFHKKRFEGESKMKPARIVKMVIKFVKYI